MPPNATGVTDQKVRKDVRKGRAKSGKRLVIEMLRICMPEKDANISSTYRYMSSLHIEDTILQKIRRDKEDRPFVDMMKRFHLSRPFHGFLQS